MIHRPTIRLKINVEKLNWFRNNKLFSFTQLKYAPINQSAFDYQDYVGGHTGFFNGGGRRQLSRKIYRGQLPKKSCIYITIRQFSVCFVKLFFFLARPVYRFIALLIATPTTDKYQLSSSKHTHKRMRTSSFFHRGAQGAKQREIKINVITMQKTFKQTVIVRFCFMITDVESLIVS